MLSNIRALSWRDSNSHFVRERAIRSGTRCLSDAENYFRAGVDASPKQFKDAFAVSAMLPYDESV